MSNLASHRGFQSNSPLASTEEKSLQDNIDINKLNLEKGLRNRPNQNVLVDRGILLNPGKAHSDKMHLLDLAKKRDKLKKKIENRPDREELVRKLILPEGIDNRKNEFNKIKHILDSSINTRPGSLELVDKNILKIDHLFASKLHNGDISYPKVCLEDISFDSNSITSLPSISEVDLTTSLNDLSDIVAQSPTKTSTNKGAQISSKKTSRLGRFYLHNIEFRQKAREFQQNELLEYEKIQAQHDPSLKRVHSELTMKSRNINECRSDKNRSSKLSLLHRLNVHELKSECKLRLISCSNVPKVQLVERLLPYESEILSSHSSFDQNRSLQINTPDRRSNPSIKGVLDYSPPDFVSKSNHTPSYSSLLEHHQIMEPLCNGKISHSQSEPIIQDFIDHSNLVSPRQLNVANPTTIKFFHNVHNFNPNNSYPIISGDLVHPQISCSSVLRKEYPQQSIKTENVLFQYQPNPVLNYTYFNGFETKIEPSCFQQLHHSMSPPETFYNSGLSIENSSSFVNPTNTSANNNWSNQVPIVIPSEVGIPLIPIDCIHKFEKIDKCTVLYKNKVDEINRLKNSNCTVMPVLLDEYKYIRDHLIYESFKMIEFIQKEQHFKSIDNCIATKQLDWLKNLLDLIDTNFSNSSVKIENHLNGTELLSSNGGVSISNGDCEMQRQNSLDDMLDFYNTESNETSEMSMDNNVFLENGKVDMFLINQNPFNDGDLKTPETPFSELCYSPMSIDYLDQIINCLPSPLNGYYK